MKIDSILPSRVSPGQSVIIQGSGLEDTEKVFLGEQQVSFDADGQTLVVLISDGAGPVEVTVQGADNASDTSSITIE